MANMSYCRFHNTQMDLEDCLDALANEEELSKSEFRKCKQMFKDIMNFLWQVGIVEDDEAYERMEDFFKSINVESDEED